MTESKDVIRERFFALFGAIVGISVGLVGNVFATYLYEFYKDTPLIHVIAFGSLIYLIGVLSVMTVYMFKLGKKIAK